MLLCQSNRHLDFAEIDPAFRHDVLNGLSIRPRAIPARWHYDRWGSVLFDAITTLPEYYLTRTERSILSKAASEIAALTGSGRAFVEFGSGSSAKTPTLLSAVNPSAYVPIDICTDFLWRSIEQLSKTFPNLSIYPVEEDFTSEIRLPAAIQSMPRLGFFPGSTIGNFVVPAAVDIPAAADNIPVPDRSEDFIITSHLVEHLPNLAAAFLEWNRILRDGGYVFMIVPLRGALPADESRELTSLSHFIEDYQQKMTLETHSIDGVPGGRAGHYHTFTPDSLLEVVHFMREKGLCNWSLVAREEVDTKVENGFTLVFKVWHRPTGDGCQPGLAEATPALVSS